MVTLKKQQLGYSNHNSDIVLKAINVAARIIIGFLNLTLISWLFILALVNKIVVDLLDFRSKNEHQRRRTGQEQKLKNVPMCSLDSD